jgi:hypothetical protein
LYSRRKRAAVQTSIPSFFQPATSSPPPKPSTSSADPQPSTSKAEDKTPITEVEVAMELSSTDDTDDPMELSSTPPSLSYLKP